MFFNVEYGIMIMYRFCSYCIMVFDNFVLGRYLFIFRKFIMFLMIFVGIYIFLIVNNIMYKLL